MKTTIDLPETLVLQARQRALHLGRSFKDLVAEYIRQGLSDLPPQEPADPTAAVVIAADGLPIYLCDPSTPAVTPSLAELLALEHTTLVEEDRQRAGLPD